MDPLTLWSKIRLSQAYAQVEQYREAIDTLKDMNNGAAEFERARVYALAGRRQDAVRVLEAGEAGARGPNREAAYDLALIHTALGQKDAAFHWLNVAYDERVYQVIYLRVDPRLDSLRADPRYAALVRRVGFP